MSRLVEFPLDDGGTVSVAVADDGRRGASKEVTRGLRREGDVVERGTMTFNSAVEVVRPAADVLLRRLRELHHVPDEITVEFGLELGAEAGAFIAAASTSAQFRISMTWSRDNTSAGDAQAREAEGSADGA